MKNIKFYIKYIKNNKAELFIVLKKLIYLKFINYKIIKITYKNYLKI